MKLTILTLYHEFPIIFIFRVTMTLVAFAAGVVLFVCLFKKNKISCAQKNEMIILWLYVLVILYFTVFGRYSHAEPTIRLELFNSYKEYLLTGNRTELNGIIINIAIFIPFAFLTAEILKHQKPVMMTLGAGMILTLSIESLQYATRTGTLETDDMLNNMLGTVFGILLWCVWHEISSSKMDKEQN